MAQENTVNDNGRLAEESKEEERFPGPQPDPLLAELIRLVQGFSSTATESASVNGSIARAMSPARS